MSEQNDMGAAGTSPPDVILSMSPFGAKILQRIVEDADPYWLAEVLDPNPPEDEDEEVWYEALEERVTGFLDAFDREVDEQLARTSDDRQNQRRAPSRASGLRYQPRQSSQPSEAERIAQKMAKAARDATEGR